MHLFLDKKAKHCMLMKDNTCPKLISSTTTSTENEFLDSNISV